MLGNISVGTIVVVILIGLILFFAIRNVVRHFKGEGGCCGGGGEVIAEDEKKLEGDVIAEKIIHIDGMHCDNCKNSVERSINRIEGASCKVNLKKKIATVKLDRDIEDDVLRIAVERLDFKVVSIENIVTVR